VFVCPFTAKRKEQRVLAPYKNSRDEPQAVLQPIHATLSGETAEALGLTASGVISLCRALIRAGYDPATPLHAYRDGTLALVVRAIGEAATLRISRIGFVRDRQYRPPPESRERLSLSRQARGDS
jgi:hypothetical protein